MAKKRTRSQKIQASQKKPVQFNLDVDLKPAATQKAPTQQNSYAIQTQYLKRDLLKSLIISVCIGFVLFGFWIVLR